MVKAGPPATPPSGNRTVIVIDPSALPRDAGVQLATNDAATALYFRQWCTRPAVHRYLSRLARDPATLAT